MKDHTALTRRLLEAISDSQPIDWEAESTEDKVLRTRMNGLRLVESIATAHRSLPGRGPHPAIDPALLETTLSLPKGTGPGRWGPLELIEKLGEGGFGEVWKARETKLDREVALKLRKVRSGDDPFDGRFLDEARLLAKVDHENVLEVYGADEHEGRAGLWTKLVHGRTLEDEMIERGTFGDREAALVGIDLCRALAAVHAAGLIHRDVKTANVMRAQGGKIVLMDFGSVTALPREGREDSKAGMTGTPMSMAPEALRGEPLDASSDIYSLGVLLYRLVSVSWPFEATSLQDLTAKHRRDDRVPLRDRRPDLATEFVRVVERALSADRAERYQSAGEMETALVKAFGATTRPVDAASNDGPQLPGRRQTIAVRRRVWSAAALVLVVAAAAIGVRQYLLAPPTFRADAAMFRESQSGEGGDIRLAPGGRVRPGDKLFLEVEGTSDMHVYVINQDEMGEEYLLYPLQGFELGNPLAGGVKHRLPGPLGGVEQSWVVTSAGGKERFLLVASPDPVSLLERQIEQYAQAEPGRPIRMQQGTMPKLRGVGGFDAAGQTAQPRRSDLSDLADTVSQMDRGEQTIHIEMFDLENPADGG